MAKAAAKTKTDEPINVKAVQKAKKHWRELLPAFYRTGYTNFMDRAQSLDPENKHFWVNKNQRNQNIRVYQGWAPIEDRSELERLGLGNLIQPNGRATWMDVELWRQPKEVNEAIKMAKSERLAANSAGFRAALEAEAEEVAGRTGKKAIPFITSGDSNDVFDRKPVEAPDVSAAKK